MSPLYRGYEPKLKLDFDDIHGIQALYGKKPPEELVTAPKNVEVQLGSDTTFCDNSSIDAIFKTVDGSVFTFKGENFFRITSGTAADGFAKPISEGWPGLPGNIDAAFTYKNGKTYFFKGSKYWRYNGRNIDGDYPKQISGGFAGIPNNVDAALVWGKQSKIYFFKGNRYWLFDPLKRPPVKSNFPKPISHWKGISERINAAFQDNDGLTYFFIGGNVFRFNDSAFSVSFQDFQKMEPFDDCKYIYFCNFPRLMEVTVHLHSKRGLVVINCHHTLQINFLKIIDSNYIWLCFR